MLLLIIFFTTVGVGIGASLIKTKPSDDSWTKKYAPTDNDNAIITIKDGIFFKTAEIRFKYDDREEGKMYTGIFNAWVESGSFNYPRQG